MLIKKRKKVEIIKAVIFSLIQERMRKEAPALLSLAPLTGKTPCPVNVNAL